MSKFIIEHIDPMGQGVYKENEKIFFIPKTLPEESGTFRVLKRKKGVHFGEVISVDKASPQRMESPCPHFDSCPSCHFLHTSYESEIDFKLRNFQKLFQDFDHPEIKTIISDQRLHYRNRIQLHYDKNKIGYIHPWKNDIIEVPECKVFDVKIKDSYQYLIKHWKDQVNSLKQPPKGHVELYLKDDKVQISWNKAYAEGGFSQVNQPTNLKIQDEFRELFPRIDGGLLELFGGQGNLSQSLQYDYRWCIDFYHQPKDDQVSLDLFDEQSLEKFKLKTNQTFGTFFIDPPRSGFKNIDQWVKHFRPSKIAYLACHPATQKRDLRLLLSEYKIEEIFMIDLFPSTYHLESLVVLSSKN